MKENCPIVLTDRPGAKEWNYRIETEIDYAKVKYH